MENSSLSYTGRTQQTYYHYNVVLTILTPVLKIAILGGFQRKLLIRRRPTFRVGSCPFPLNPYESAVHHVRRKLCTYFEPNRDTNSPALSAFNNYVIIAIYFTKNL